MLHSRSPVRVYFSEVYPDCFAVKGREEGGGRGMIGRTNKRDWKAVREKQDED
jgi:hypothetical protein